MVQALLCGLGSDLDCQMINISRPLSRYGGIVRAHREHRDDFYAWPDFLRGKNQAKISAPSGAIRVVLLFLVKGP